MGQSCSPVYIIFSVSVGVIKYSLTAVMSANNIHHCLKRRSLLLFSSVWNRTPFVSKMTEIHAGNLPPLSLAAASALHWEHKALYIEYKEQGTIELPICGKKKKMTRLILLWMSFCPPLSLVSKHSFSFASLFFSPSLFASQDDDNSFTQDELNLALQDLAPQWKDRAL